MNKLLILSATNRPESKSFEIAKVYQAEANTLEVDATLVSLEELNGMSITEAMYSEQGQADQVKVLQDKYFEPATHIVIIMPEYNGTFPGILKFFLDAISVRNYKSTFGGKQVALVGVSSGRAGCLRGIDQLTNALNYLGISVSKNKIPISGVNSLFTGGVFDAEVKALFAGQVKELFGLV